MKKCYIISFDLNPNRNYYNLFEAIKSYGTWAKITESTWAIVTEVGVTQIRDNICQYINPDEKILVVKSGGMAAWRNAVGDVDWLKKYLSLI